jgi:hypothetical protein
VQKTNKMNEVWIKKTIFRRYLVEDSELEEVKSIIESNIPEVIDRIDELIGDIYDKNDEIEYDEEKLFMPLEFSIRALANER